MYWDQKLRNKHKLWLIEYPILLYLYKGAKTFQFHCVLGLAKNKIASILSRSSMGTSVRCFFEEWNNTQRFYFTFIDPEYFHYHIIQWREDVGRKLRCWNPFWWYFHRLLFMFHESIKWEAHTKVLLHSSTRSNKGVRDLYLVEYLGHCSVVLLWNPLFSTP